MDKQITVNKKQITVGLDFGVILLILFAIIGYFIYGGIDGALAITAYCILSYIAIVVALIPFGGFPLQWILTRWVIEPWIFEVTGIWATNLTMVIQILVFIAGLIICIIMSVIAFVFIAMILSIR